MRGGIEHVVVKNDRLQLTLIRNAKTDKWLKRSFMKDVKLKDVDGVACAILECTVLEYEYVGNNRDGHHVVNENGFERHDSSVEKAGDVIFYLKTYFGNARLVNRHNCEEGQEACSLELCYGEHTDCHGRSFPVNELMVVHKSSSIAEDYVPNSGYFEDGTRYYVYRMLLYTDGFNAHRSRLGSMDGMYMIPLGIPLDRRTEAGCLHKICLAPPGVAATDIISVVIEDIVEGMTNGVEVEDEDGKARAFMDLVCFNSDSPALASATGTKGHSADCPCHTCTFQKDKTGELAVVRSKGVTSSTCHAKRTHRKVRDIEKQEGNTRETLDNIGVSNSDAPLMKMADAIKRVKNIPKTSDGKPVVPNCFDPYRFSLISPDHVFLGLISNAMNVFLKLLKPAARERFDKTLTAILKHNGLFGRSTILSSEKSIMKTTISETFAILFATPIAIFCCKFVLNDVNDLTDDDDVKDDKKSQKGLNKIDVDASNRSKDCNVDKKTKKEMKKPDIVNGDNNDRKAKKKTEDSEPKCVERKALKTAVEVLKELSCIIVESQRNPKSIQDRVEVLRAFNDCEGRTRLNQLVMDVKEHCKKIEELSKIDPHSAKILDKPNMHRFVELFTHTLPLFGSLKYVEELILEKAHQGAKRAVDMSNKKNEQIQAMTVYLHDDFVTRVRSLTRNMENSKRTDWSKALELLCRHEKDGSEKCDLADLLTDDVLSVIRTLGNDMCHRDSKEYWLAEKRSAQKHTRKEFDKKLEKAKNFLQTVLVKMSSIKGWENDSTVEVLHSASLYRNVGEFEESKRLFRVTLFDVIEVYCRYGSEKKPVMMRRSELDGERRFMMVLGFLNTKQNGEQVLYAVGNFMEIDQTPKNEDPEKTALFEDEKNIEDKDAAESGRYDLKTILDSNEIEHRNESGKGRDDITEKTNGKEKGCIELNKGTNNTEDKDAAESVRGDSTRTVHGNEVEIRNERMEDRNDGPEKPNRPGKANKKEKSGIKLYKRTNNLVIFELSRCVRKAFVAHACWISEDGERSRCRKSCALLSETESIADGGKWILKGREDGYPPRSG